MFTRHPPKSFFAKLKSAQIITPNQEQEFDDKEKGQNNQPINNAFTAESSPYTEQVSFQDGQDLIINDDGKSPSKEDSLAPTEQSAVSKQNILPNKDDLKEILALAELLNPTPLLDQCIPEPGISTDKEKLDLSKSKSLSATDLQEIQDLAYQLKNDSTDSKNSSDASYQGKSDTEEDILDLTNDLSSEDSIEDEPDEIGTTSQLYIFFQNTLNYIDDHRIETALLVVGCLLFLTSLALCIALSCGAFGPVIPMITLALTTTAAPPTFVGAIYGALASFALGVVTFVLKAVEKENSSLFIR